MVIQLYSDKNPQSDQQVGLIQNLVYRGLLEGQFTPKNVKMQFVKVDQVGDKFRNAVKKAKNAQYLDDAEIVMVFEAPKTAPVADEEPENADAGEKTENAAEETVSESTKVQDLTKSVGLKTVGKSSGCAKKTCSCGKKKSAVKEEKSPKKEIKPKSKKDLEKNAPSGDEEIDEAQLEATGDELKVKIADAVKRVLYLPDDEEVEFVNLEGFKDGHDTFFAKLAFKE